MPIYRSTTFPSFRRPLFALLLCLVIAPAAYAQPQFYETVLELQQPVVNVSFVERVVYRWRTFRSSGEVADLDLEDLSMQLYGPGGLIYIDRMVVNGMAQPLSGIPRTIGGGNDIFWRFNLDSATLEQMTNVSESVILASTGGHFDVHDSTSIPDDGRVSIKFYVDGENQDPHTDQLDVQTTTPMLFVDDFETGDLTGWSASFP